MKIDEQLRNIEDLVYAMAKQVRHMMELAMEALLKNQKDKALFVIENDAHINNFELEINELAVHILSLLQPVASDLRRVIVAIKIANDVERIGDYAKNIARYVIKNESFPEVLKEDVKHIAEIFFRNYDMMLKVVKEADAVLAYSVAVEDEKMDEALVLFARRIDQSGKDVPKISVATISLLRNIERAGDHSKNVCEHIIYRCKAQYVDFG